jgi:antitoxin ParD1/3/4
MRTVEGRRSKNNRKLETLRARIKAGVEALERGEFTEVDEPDVEHYLEKLVAPRKRAR